MLMRYHVYGKYLFGRDRCSSNEHVNNLEVCQFIVSSGSEVRLEFNIYYEIASLREAVAVVLIKFQDARDPLQTGWSHVRSEMRHNSV